MKKTVNTSFIYAILAMIGGVFYREFTKFQGFEEKDDVVCFAYPFIYVGYGYVLVSDNMYSSFCIG